MDRPIFCAHRLLLEATSIHRQSHLRILARILTKQMQMTYLRRMICFCPYYIIMLLCDQLRDASLLAPCFLFPISLLSLTFDPSLFTQTNKKKGRDVVCLLHF